MLESLQRPQSSVTVVAVIPGNQRGAAVADIRRAELAPGSGSVLGCVLGLRGGGGGGGRLVVWDAADREAPPAAVDDSCSDFSWEEVSSSSSSSISSSSSSSFRLVAVGCECDLKLLQVTVQRSTCVSVLCVSHCPADELLQTLTEQVDGDEQLRELRSMRVLSFAAGRCRALLNDHWLLQLQWRRQEEAEPQKLTWRRLGASGDGEGRAAVHHCLCRDFLFTLGSSGLIRVYDITDGCLLASVDLPAYLSSVPVDEEYVFPSSSSFCVLQVSADLSTAVAVTQTHAAVAVDLDLYFRMFPQHLLCAAPPAGPPLHAQQPGDQDRLLSSSCSLAALGSTFSPDR
ncbi:spatacsin isoform X3 [Solea senegalensis]|uniref:Spatacsin isoform X3 n=1 Tax=Solea senegalensis TaxID=28829 RepID=A0AAV6P9J9_SOLSE|nr:spatacsin isoform X3 [Solea senegalensis]